MIKLKLSQEMHEYFPEASIDCVITSIASIIGGYCISYSALELLKDLNLVTGKRKINKNGRKVLAAHLHRKFHENRDGVKLIKPQINKNGDKNDER